MLTQYEIGRVAGIPIYLDMLFVLVLLLFTAHFFTAGSSQAVSAGILVVAGLLMSVLLHELGHAFAGRLFNARVTHIELTGLGGLAHFERSLPKSALARTVIFLAGPAVNGALWLLFDAALEQASLTGSSLVGLVLYTLAIANFYLMLFNLLPALPLDGGHTLEAWMSPMFGTIWATRIVGSSGVVLAVLLALSAFPLNIWRLLLAFFLFQANWEALQRVGGWRGRG